MEWKGSMDIEGSSWNHIDANKAFIFKSIGTRAALTIGLGGAEAPGPEQGGGPWLAVE